MAAFQSFAIVPAAGLSARMGAPKLLLPMAGQTLIQRTLAVWLASRVTRTVVVVRAHDISLLRVCREARVDVVEASRATLDMKASVRLAVRHIAEHCSPKPEDAWLVSPADMPWLSPQVIDGLLAKYDPQRTPVVVPTFAGKRGHPAMISWSFANLLEELKADEGINSLLAKLPVREILWHDDSILRDIDTPNDYRSHVAALCGA